jgi:hypothetical protein
MKLAGFDCAVRCLAAGFSACALVAIGAPPSASASALCCPPVILYANVDVQLFNAETGAPVSGVHVRFFRLEDGRTAGLVVTDRNGEARTRLDSGGYRFVVMKPGFQQARGSVAIESSHDNVTVGMALILIQIAPGITPITEDASLCVDMIEQYQPGTVYVVCNGP